MKAKLSLIFRFLIFSLLFFISSRASIGGVIFPFSFGLLFALAWGNQKVYFLVPAFLLGTIANNYSFAGIICAIATVSLLAIPFYIHLLIRKPMQKWELFLYAFLSQGAFLVFGIINGLSAIVLACHIIFGLGLSYLAVVFIEAIVLRGVSSKLSSLELIAGCALILVFSAGLSSCDISGFSIFKLFAFFAILSLSHVTSPSVAFCVSAVMGMGAMLSTQNPLYVAPLMLACLFATALKKLNRIFSAVGCVIAEVLSIFYFSLYYSASWLQIIPAVVAAIVFVVLPQKFYSQIGVLFNVNYQRMAAKNLINRNREVMQHRLERLGEVFFEMNVVFKKLIKKHASEEEAKSMIFEELKANICKGCPDHKHCHRTFNEDTKKIFLQLITISLEKGKITLLDLPNYLASRCGKANVIINEINTLTKQYKSYRELVGSVDTSKLLISDQLEGVSGIMKALSKEVDCMISMDNERERKLIEELSANNIICMDALVYQKDAYTAMATLVVREEDAQKLKLQEVVGKICQSKMCIYDVKQSEKAGLVCLSLKTAPAYDCVFGLAVNAKGGTTISGDRHCIERLDGDKFIFAICDGMGSGERAAEKSDTAISLIENFYKAGFDSEIILSSVNKLLGLEGDEIFSTIDACIVDLKNGVGDFVKMGAASSYIRGEEGCEIIENKTLPVGVVQSVNVKTQKVVLRDKDYIVLCSDGVNDSFASDGEFKDFLLSLKSSNPQEQADQIMKKALSKNNGYAVDDMTVLVVKIFS